MKRSVLNALISNEENIQLSDSEYAILTDLIHEIELGHDYTIQSFAQKNFVSSSTITRLCQKFGFGFREMKQFLKSELHGLHYKQVNSEITPNHNVHQLYQLMNESVSKTFDHIFENDLLQVIEALKNAHKILIIATGLSQIAADYFSQRLQIIGKQANALNIGLSFGIFEQQFKSADLIIIISRSGNSSLLINKIQLALTLNKPLIAIGCKKQSPFGQQANLCLPIYGSERSFDQSKLVTTYNLSVFFLIDMLINNLLGEEQ